nr:N-acetylglucosamine-6-O-sulfatase-like [Nerophis lumbriciformis]
MGPGEPRQGRGLDCWLWRFVPLVAHGKQRPAADRRAVQGLLVRGHLRSALALLAIAVLTTCAQPQQQEQPRPQPNNVPVIVIDIDTLRADHLGCYGYERPTSPKIDAFAEESALFSWAFSQAPNTPPSQASILTGLYPTSHGRIQDADILPAAVVTLAEVFKEAGYATAGIVDGGLVAAEFGLDQGFDLYDDEAGGLAKIDGKARDWLRQHKEQPFLLLVHTYDVHSPYDDSPEPFRSAFLDRVEVPSENFVRHMTWEMSKRNKSRWEDEPYQLSQVEVEYAKALYDGGILHVDDWFGQFVDFLRQEGIYDRALIVFVSDHGDEFEEHDALFHDRLYTPVTRIPLMIRFPGGRWAQRIDAAVESVDLMPTLIRAAGLEQPSGLNGQDLSPLIESRGNYRELAVSESPYFGRRIALTTNEYRLHYTARDGSGELYRYRQDPLELEDVAAQNTDLVERLSDAARGWSEMVEAHSHETTAAEIDDSTLEQLRALGYID